jgi:Xaa-Pro dipeptidase
VSITPSCLAPDRNEIASRIERVRFEMRALGVTHYVCQSPDNIFYLTNVAIQVHERPFILVLPEHGTPVFLIPKLDQWQIPRRSVGAVEFLHYAEFPAPAGLRWSDKLLSLVQGGVAIGIETVCPQYVANVIPGKRVVADIVDDVRMVKSEFEIARIAYSSQLMSAAHVQLLAMAEPGKSVRETYRLAEDMTRRMLSDNADANVLATRMFAMVQPGKYSHDPHNFYADSTMAFDLGGPHISVIAGRANGYGAEVERTFFLGEIPEAARRPFEVMLGARALAFELCIPGAIMGEVDRKVARFIRARGYGENICHRTGHSFGVTGHEAPFLADGYEHEIKPNMVFSIEPGIYVPAVGGFRFSDTVLVTETGNMALTRAPESAAELTLPVH